MNLVNKITNNKEIVILFTFLIIVVVSTFFVDTSRFEGYSNYNLANPGEYPKSEDVPILTDSYPFTGRKNVDKNNYNDIWWHYPIFEVGSYTQITNNLNLYKWIKRLKGRYGSYTVTKSKPTENVSKEIDVY